MSTSRLPHRWSQSALFHVPHAECGQYVLQITRKLQTACQKLYIHRHYHGHLCPSVPALKKKLCSQRVSIPRPLVYKTNALPLSYGSAVDASHPFSKIHKHIDLPSQHVPNALSYENNHERRPTCAFKTTYGDVALTQCMLDHCVACWC